MRRTYRVTILDLLIAVFIVAVSISIYTFGLKFRSSSIALLGGIVFVFAFCWPLRRFGLRDGSDAAHVPKFRVLPLSIALSAAIYCFGFLPATWVLVKRDDTDWFEHYHLIYRPLAQAAPTFVIDQSERAGLTNVEAFFFAQVLTEDYVPADSSGFASIEALSRD